MTMESIDKIGDTKNVNKYIFHTNQKITKEGAEKSRRVDSGDFILSNSMSYGKPYIMKTTGYIHDGWFKLKLLDSSIQNTCTICYHQKTLQNNSIIWQTAL